METKGCRGVLIFVLMSFYNVLNEAESNIYMAFGFKNFEQGKISTSTDQGNTWEIKTLLNFAPVMAFCFDSSNCYVIAQNSRHFQVLVTSDKGKIWKTIALFKNTEGHFPTSGGLSCFSYTKCVFVVGNMIGSFTDRFQYLKILRPPGKNNTRQLTEVTCLSSSVCIATVKKYRQGIILRSADWGLNWVTVQTSPSGFQDISCVQSTSKAYPSEFCMAVTEAATVFVSYDLGISWKQVIYDVDNEYFSRRHTGVGEPVVDLTPIIQSVFCPQPELCVLGFRANRIQRGLNITSIQGALCTMKVDSHKGRGDLKCKQLSYEAFSVSIHCATPHHCLAVHRNENNIDSKCCSSELHELNVNNREWVLHPSSPPVGRYPVICGSTRDFTVEDSKLVNRLAVSQAGKLYYNIVIIALNFSLLVGFFE